MRFTDLFEQEEYKHLLIEEEDKEKEDEEDEISEILDDNEEEDEEDKEKEKEDIKNLKEELDNELDTEDRTLAYSIVQDFYQMVQNNDLSDFYMNEEGEVIIDGYTLDVDTDGIDITVVLREPETTIAETFEFIESVSDLISTIRALVV